MNPHPFLLFDLRLSSLMMSLINQYDVCMQDEAPLILEQPKENIDGTIFLIIFLFNTNFYPVSSFTF